ncbi:4Fe-4S dicluster domain-containing protein [Bacillus sp. FJAT-27251]|uniref:4Fe-4S dicluster domain-containing protein n=1 Tax=Bacillus sp. FJAT-27251 TaxID=1684142 RepID=UPI0009E52D3B|nr:4Fe-4S dicluster domain-containing protein [Bacillus sp. FJAT-27251]
MKQLGFLVHLERCLGCRSCEFSCKNEHGQDDTFRRKIHSLHNDREEKPGHSFHHFSMSCNHCGNPVCMSVCPENAIQKKPNGIVVIDQTKCTGCGRCGNACPFDAIAINPITAKADKCDMCYNRQMRGEPTVCVSSCPVQAIEIIDLYDAKSDQYDKAAYGFEMKKMSNPSIRFTNTEKRTHQFWTCSAK